ncbi:MAG: DNA starvation/stationary phase protection protein [Bacteroidia bacterium]|nr:DNA starvation/stationary phase protection protein [Bacteroidia bacterium]
MKPHIGISEKHLTQINSLLEVSLANEVTLYTKTRKFHWNISGESFMELHRLFEKHYKQLEEIIDLVAERIGKLGGKTPGTMEEFIKLTILKEHSGKYPTQKEMLKELLSDHESIIVSLRKDIEACNSKLNDAGTTDFLTGLLQEHETIAWVLRRYLS